ncbi:hypothetical protein DTL42_03385 [Bremerella cremea]|uniref:SecDF P1 head subdomain domain-containing protein n=1 Tax=Bremerella cremea TaxID=1031537 RepID=A0A368KXN0_9BACT|nr:hypothetical protein [Bremerella cremea]RCS54204.1 hypothetical protein DTL42_03385 [Bremerella cremea]
MLCFNQQRIRYGALLTLLALAAVGCGKLPTPQPTPNPVPPGMRVEIYELDPTEGETSLTAVHPATGKPIFLKTPPLIGTSDVATVAEVEEEYPLHSESVAFQIDLNTAGAAKMSQATATPNGQELVLVLNGSPVAVAKVMAKIGTQMVITGGNDTGEFARQISALTSGK